MLLGLTFPLLFDFLYYFKTEELGISQFTYQMLTVCGGVFLTLSIILYQLVLSKYESRTLIFATICLDIFIAFTDLGFVLRWNVALGIGDITWLLFGSTSLMSMKMGLLFIVPFVLVSKIIPAHVEATVFAFSSSIIGMSLGWGKILGAIWNHYFFKIDADNMENLPKLIML